ncbi:hypothetical protein AADZ91_11805 [Colwelliaceae bacterium 6441]
MDVFTELLKPSNNFKAENTAKDRKQKSKKYTNKKYDVKDSFDDKVLNLSSRKISNWDEVERRSGRDRREQMEGRGRWLESRAEKDRRQLAKAIQLKI